jgi:hypothetical protein
MSASGAMTFLDPHHAMMRYDAVDAHDFARHLNPGDILLPPSGSTWIYRGHANADWPLLPGLWRDPWQFEALMSNSLADSDCEAALAVERALVDEFVRQANDLGFELPGELGYLGPLSRELYHRYDEGGGFDIDNRQRALAQHYGVPTSLLDWSEDPFVAAYFAIQPAPDTDDSDRACVWALNELLAGRSPGPRSKHSARRSPRLEIVRLMKGYNANITAQAGVFTFLNPGTGEWVLENEDDEPIRDCVEELVNLEDWILSVEPPVPQPSLVQVTIPRSEIAEMQQILTSQRITRARLVPQLDSVAMDVLARARE